MKGRAVYSGEPVVKIDRALGSKAGAKCRAILLPQSALYLPIA